APDAHGGAGAGGQAEPARRRVAGRARSRRRGAGLERARTRGTLNAPSYAIPPRRQPMPAQQPTDIHRLMSEALATSDRDAALALYEPDAVFVPQPGQVASGLAA